MEEDKYTTDMITNLIQMLQENQTQDKLIDEALKILEDSYDGECR